MANPATTARPRGKEPRSIVIPNRYLCEVQPYIWGPVARLMRSLVHWCHHLMSSARLLFYCELRLLIDVGLCIVDLNEVFVLLLEMIGWMVAFFHPPFSSSLILDTPWAGSGQFCRWPWLHAASASFKMTYPNSRAEDIGHISSSLVSIKPN